MMQRFAHRSVLIVIDLAVLAIAYSLAFLIRFDGQIPLLMTKKLLFTLPYIVIFQFLVLLFSGVTRFAWRYISLREVIRFGLAFGVANGFLLFVRHGSIEIKPHFGYAEYAVIPM